MDEKSIPSPFGGVSRASHRFLRRAAFQPAVTKPQNNTRHTSAFKRPIFHHVPPVVDRRANRALSFQYAPEQTWCHLARRMIKDAQSQLARSAEFAEYVLREKSESVAFRRRLARSIFGALLELLDHLPGDAYHQLHECYASAEALATDLMGAWTETAAAKTQVPGALREEVKEQLADHLIRHEGFAREGEPLEEGNHA